MRIREIHRMVLDTLRKYPSTRSSDAELQCQVIATYFGDHYLNMPYAVVLKYHKELPSLESVGRARRKCQELHPELKATDNVEAMRELNEEEFVGYVRSTVK